MDDWGQLLAIVHCPFQCGLAYQSRPKRWKIRQHMVNKGGDARRLAKVGVGQEITSCG
jgi:hypothetical protein